MMILELKAIFRDKFIRFVLFASVCFFVYCMYKMYGVINTSQTVMADNYRFLFLREYDLIKRNGDSSQDAYEKNWRKYQEYMAETYLKYSELFDEGMKNNRAELKKSYIISTLINMQLHTNPETGLYPTDIYKQEIGEYIGIEKLPFDLELFKEFSPVYNPLYSDNKYELDKIELERFIDLKERKLEDIDIMVESPWTFLQYSNSGVAFRNLLYTSTVFIGAYVIYFYDKSGQRDVVELLPRKKNNYFKRYVAFAFTVSLIILCLPEILSVLFMGYRHGFAGVTNFMYIYSKGLNSFEVYEHIIGNSMNGIAFGLSNHMPVEETVNGYLYCTELKSLPFYVFILLAMAIDILKIFLFSVIGVLIGIFAKNRSSCLIISTLVTVFIIASLNVSELATKYNPLSIQSGWNVTLGWTNMSWLNAVLLLVLSVTMVTAVGAVIFERSQMR